MFSTQPSCCHEPDDHDHQHKKKRLDWLLWGSFVLVAFAYLLDFYSSNDHASAVVRFTSSVHTMVNDMFWGVVVGIAMLGFLARVPRDMIMALLGSERGLKGILRATLAGLLFDVCSHGILMLGAKLYERGASIGQTMAFLIASPWNSISLTFVLISLIGLKWTLAFIALSMVVGVASGLIFDFLVDKSILPANPNRRHLDPQFKFWPEAKAKLKSVTWTPAFIAGTVKMGLMESGMVLRWLFVGVIITGALHVMVAPDALYQKLFGPSLTGLGITFLVSTVMEVCSEGALPIAADIFKRTGAIGNSFVFLMAGVSTNYTTIIVLRQATKFWKIALFLPLVSVPQILLLGFLLNHWS